MALNHFSANHFGAAHFRTVFQNAEAGAANGFYWHIRYKRRMRR